MAFDFQAAACAYASAKGSVSAVPLFCAETAAVLRSGIGKRHLAGRLLLNVTCVYIDLNIMIPYIQMEDE